jgi:hypothetical protein
MVGRPGSQRKDRSVNRKLLPWLLLLASAVVTATNVRAQDARVIELERRVDVLTREIEDLKLGSVADTMPAVARMGLGRAASKVYSVTRGVSLGGYGEMLYENFDRVREDDQPSGRLDRLDFLRAVVYLGYKFTGELLFNSEIEIEHGGVQDEATVEGDADPVTGEVEGEARLSGDVVVEFAYVEWAPRREIGVRAGMLLVPVGLVNEMHEPPLFFGARRPEVEQRIIPTTWRANGVGLFGELANGFAYRTYLTEGLDAAGFDAAEGIGGGRQSGSRSFITRPAVSARVDYAGQPGLVLGVSAFTGDSWQQFQPTALELEPRVTVIDAHARLEWRGLEVRAQYARGTLDDAAELSDALGLTGSDRLGESFYGGYVEAGWDALSALMPETRFELAPYIRYERYDTQDDVPGGTEDPAHERTVVTLGAALRPHPDIVLKADRQLRSNEAETESSQWNVALGYMF